MTIIEAATRAAQNAQSYERIERALSGAGQPPAPFSVAAWAAMLSEAVDMLASASTPDDLSESAEDVAALAIWCLAALGNTAQQPVTGREALKLVKPDLGDDAAR